MKTVVHFLSKILVFFLFLNVNCKSSEILHVRCLTHVDLVDAYQSTPLETANVSAEYRVNLAIENKVKHENFHLFITTLFSNLTTKAPINISHNKTLNNLDNSHRNKICI